MSEDLAIEVQNVSKNFSMSSSRANTIKSLLTGFHKDSDQAKGIQHALTDISFEVKKGEFFGIVGRNGGGKSTLLKMLAGIYQPTKGNIVVSGKLVPFIELGVGFNPDLTGRENVYMNGALLGFSKKQVDNFYNEVVEFAELEQFMDKKLKNYSSGMQVRLAFSMAIRSKADVLLVDEVLAVGDLSFQRKCFDYFKKLKKDKVTVIFVTHDMDAVREYCDRAMLINDSKLVEIGETDSVAKHYTKLFQEQEGGQTGVGKRWGDGSVQFTKVSASKKVYKKGEPLTVTCRATANTDIEGVILGFTIKNAANHALFGTNTKIQGKEAVNLRAGEEVEIEWEIDNILSDGKYYFEPAIVHTGGIVVADWYEDALVITNRNNERTPYPVSPNTNIKSIKLL